MSLVKKSVDEWLNDIDYEDDPTYVPSEFALEFVSFVKLVNGEKGEENKTPVIHYQMLDKIAGKNQNTANMCARDWLRRLSSLNTCFYIWLCMDQFQGLEQ